MKFWMLSDNHDTLMGMRLAGIEGELVEQFDQLPQRLNQVFEQPDVGIIMITEKLYSAQKDYIGQIRLSRTMPLIVKIPDRHDDLSAQDDVAEYLKKAIGINL